MVQKLEYSMNLTRQGYILKTSDKGPIGMIHRALRERLSSWALLDIGIVRGSVLKIVTVSRPQDRLVTTLKTMEIIEIPNFDLQERAMRKNEKPGEEGSQRGNIWDLKMAAKRMNTGI